MPLLFLADAPGYMIGTQVERQGIIRSGAKMISAVSEATVPKISVIVRKAYGAGLYAMAGPAFDPAEELRAEYAEEIDILHLASELVVDAVVAPEALRSELVKRYAVYASRDRSWPARRNSVTPV